MRILGIDPGLQVCGYACLDSDGHQGTIVEAGVLRTEGALSLERRLNQIAVDIGTLLDRFRPQVVAVEQLYSHYAHPRTAILRGHARGVILQKSAAAGLEVAHVHVEGGEAGAVKRRRHFHLAVDTLLSQHRHSGSLSCTDERRRNILINIKRQISHQPGIVFIQD